MIYTFLKYWPTKPLILNIGGNLLIKGRLEEVCALYVTLTNAFYKKLGTKNVKELQKLATKLFDISSDEIAEETLRIVKNIEKEME